MKNSKQPAQIFWFSLMFTFGLALRLLFLPARTLDMGAYIQWYDYIARHGIVQSLGEQFSGYNPPFIYLLALTTLTKSFLPKILAIKLVPIALDILCVIFTYKIVKLRFPEGPRAMLAALVMWVAPTILINSSLWGQTDSLYTAFLLLCVYYLLKDHPTAGVIAFAVSFAIKAQAVFLAPLLAVLFFKRRIAWYTFFWIPIIYAAAFIPTMLAGRSITTIFSTYAVQSETFAKASMNAANFYFFLRPRDYQTALLIGLPLSALLLLTWALVYGRKAYSTTPDILMHTALVSAALVPFILPKMHDRYFYPADVFSIIAAFYSPGMWFVAAAYQVISLLSYMPYLFAFHPQNFIPPAVWVNAITLGYLLWKQWRMTSHDEVPGLP